MLFSAPLAHMDNVTPHLHVLASWSSFCLAFSIKLGKTAPQPQHQVLTLPWCQLVPPFCPQEGPSPRGEQPRALDAAAGRLHGEEQVVPRLTSTFDGLLTVLLCLNLGSPALLAIRGALLSNHQIVWLNIKL